MKPTLLLLVLAVAASVAAAAAQPAHAQSMGTAVHLYPLPSSAEVGEDVELYGWLSDADGHAVPDATIYVRDDVGLGSDETIAILTTDADGLFLAYWTAERRPAGGSWDFYAVFEGEDGLRKSRSDTYAVDVAGGDARRAAYLDLDPLPSAAAVGDAVRLGGWMYDDAGLPVEGATIYVKDDVGLGSDETIAILTTDADGEFYTEWTAERRPAGGSWHFYAVFEGEGDLRKSRSETRSVEVAGIVSVPAPAQPAPDADDSGCLIATAAHGTELAPQVQALREYRDGTLLATGSGSAFMSAFSAAYYSFSPHVADMEREYPAFRQAVAAAIAPMLHALQVASLADPGSESSVALHGIAALLLVVGLYVGAPVAGAAAAAAALRGRQPPRWAPVRLQRMLRPRRMRVRRNGGGGGQAGPASRPDLIRRPAS